MVPLGKEDPTHVGGYRLLECLGAGGMGRVFLGRSPGGRRVAVKLMRTDRLDDPRFRDRFVREIEAARRVGGFHTAQVVDADPTANPPWMVTAYVPGPSLAEAVAAHGPLTPGGVRVLGSGLAEGLAAIHACGLVHRDLKPGNVIMSEDGPRIIDFGIVRALDVPSMTQTGVMLGTLPYMSPEQFADRPVEKPSDVFSLGSVLTFAACGHPPFGSAPLPAVVHRIINASPDLSGLPTGHDLHHLIGACLAKNPADRPTTAELLAGLADHDRRRGTGMDAGGPPRPVSPLSVERATSPATTEDDRKPARKGLRRVPRRAVLAGGLGGALLAAGVPLGRSLTHRSPPRPQPPRGPFREASLVGNAKVYSLAISPDGRTLVTGHSDGTTNLWDLTHRPKVASLPHPTHGVFAVAISPDGRTLATAGGAGMVRLWDTASRTQIGSDLAGHTKDVNSVVFHPSGRILATGSDDKTVRLWDVPSRTALGDPLRGHTAGVYAVAFSPDLTTLCSAGADFDIRVWNVQAGKTIFTPMTGHTDTVYSLAFNPDGTRLASGSGDQTARLWSVGEALEVATFSGHTGSVLTTAFSPDGKRLATAGTDHTVRLWTTADQTNTAVLRGHTERVQSVGFSPDGRTLFSGGDDKATLLWRLSAG
ncbi:serine/threonine-protein kinase [Actinomadura sp. DC4]|uniref:WD40 repeat domain-containing serine/threonine protein kinase n=1 Tax=Actinomadura sp. DC4 TaxID=3055069 RepID=UPI0025AF430B|nr:serine/threonine-protein kinase [Actinomadura sp. DC4]MDN3352282.1 serine/threonine-protein kinase [Actinomadura sp. DC4]